MWPAKNRFFFPKSSVAASVLTFSIREMFVKSADDAQRSADHLSFRHFQRLCDVFTTHKVWGPNGKLNDNHFRLDQSSSFRSSRSGRIRDLFSSFALVALFQKNSASLSIVHHDIRALNCQAWDYSYFLKGFLNLHFHFKERRSPRVWAVQGACYHR